MRERTWCGVLVSTTAAGAAVLAAALLLAAAVSGAEAVWSALIGGAAVLVLSSLSIGVVAAVDRRWPDLTVPLFLMALVVKLVVLGLALAAVPVPLWRDPWWGVLTAVAVLIAWQAGLAAGFRRMRFTVEA